jgi:sugar O-acyltransferase (sialic acid O-acetyltransferase NeuD family)
MKDLAIYGFGGFGKEVATIIKKINEVSPTWNMIGFFDDGYDIGTQSRYGRILGGISELNAYKTELSVVIAIASSNVIEKLSKLILNPNVSFPNIIAPNVFFFDKESVEMGRGNIITYGCRLSCEVKIGDFNVLNGSVSLGHDVEIGNFNILFPETRLSGMVRLGNYNLLGTRTFIYQKISIGNRVHIAAGSYVMRNTKDICFYIGNPAKRVDCV